jgi:hypothetical protein
MSVIRIILEGEGAFPELAGRDDLIHMGDDSVIAITGLEEGMESGLPSVAMCFWLPDGTPVLCETSLRLLLTAADALKARFGDPR